MEKLKKQQIKATILLEALLALGVFSILATLVLGQINQSRKEQAQILQKEEVLRTVQMALQTQQDKLSLNGVNIQIVKNKQEIVIYHEGEEVIHVQKN